MKKLILILASIVLLAGCYSDKGNYDYRFDDLNSFETTFSPTPYLSLDYNVFEFAKPMAGDVTKQIKVTTKQTKFDNEDNLEYEWYLPVSGGYDTVRTKGYYDVELKSGKDVNYTMLLKIYDTSTTLSTHYAIRVATRLAYKNSWFVLHGNAGERKVGNVENYSDTPSILSDSYAEIYGTNPFSDATGIFYDAYQWGSKEYINSELMTVVDSKGAMNAYRPFGFLPRTNETVMLPSGGDYTCRKLIYHTVSDSFVVMVSTEGEALFGFGLNLLFEPGTELSDSDKELHLDPSTYTVSDAVISDGGMTLLWDTKCNRMLFYNIRDNQYQGYGHSRATTHMTAPMRDAGIDYSVLAEDERPQDKTLRYMYTIPNIMEGYALFSDQSGQLHHYTIKLPSSKDKAIKRYVARADGKEGSVEELCSITSQSMQGSLKVNDRSVMLASPVFSKMIFYSVDNKLYRFDLQSQSNSLVYTAPEGSVITHIKWRVPEELSYFWKDAIRYMGIALDMGNGKGALTEIKFTVAGDVDDSCAPQLYEGFESIADIIFAQLYYTL